MSELTNIHARAVKDLTTPTELPVDHDALEQVKLVAGNFPTEYAGNEALTVKQIKDLATVDLESKKANKTDVEVALSNLSTTANKFYPTLSEANSHLATMSVNAVVTIGEEANKGLWYKATAGATTLTKSAYDPLTQANNYTNNKAIATKTEAVAIAKNYTDLVFDAVPTVIAPYVAQAEAAATAATISAGVFETPEAGVDPLTGVSDGAYFNVRSPSSDSYIDEYQNIGGSAVATGKSYPSSNAKWDASLVVDASGETQQEINDFGGAKWRNKPLGYDIGSTVKLENGDIVKNTESNNTNDPNVDMTGWKFNDNTVESIAELIAIQEPKDKQTVFVKSQLTNGLVGGGYYTYNNSTSSWDKIVTNLVVSPESFGADINKPDNTQEIQKALLFVQANGGHVDGGYKKYKCANLVIDSNMSLRNIYLENNVFNQNLVSVITTTGADAERTPLTNVELINVHIDGKRSMLTGMPTGPFSEDGGRHGFRFVRPINGLVMRGCSANYCGVDGIIIFPIRDIPYAEWKHYVKNVVIENCDFHFNGRHGGSSDSVDGLTLRNLRLTGNGLDVVEGAPQTSGGAGRIDPVSGKLYGAGWDFEEYLSEAYSINISVEYCVMTGNAGAGTVFVRTGGILQPTRNVVFLGGKYDKGVAGVSIGNAAISLSGYLIDFYNWYDISFIDVDFSGDNLYILRSKVTLINPKNLGGAGANDKSTLVSDTHVPITNWASDVRLSAQLQVKPDGVSQQQVIGMSGIAGTSSSLLFYDGSASLLRGGIEVESGSSVDSTMYLSVQGARRWMIQANGSLLPLQNAVSTIGYINNRVSTIYLATAPVVGSDIKYKKDVESISDVEREVAIELKSCIKKYRLIDSDDKHHIGLIAQEVESVFAKHGLNAHDYKLLQYSADSETYALVYEQLMLFIISAM